MDTKPQPTPELRRVGELISAIEIAMLVTADPDGALHSRPLRTLQMDSEGALWFMTTISSPKIGEMDEHRRVSLSYMHSASERYVWASGVTQTAHGHPWPRSLPAHPARALAASKRLALRDEEKARELWTLALRPWLPHGRDDPEAVLLKVTIEEAEYWERGRSEVIPLAAVAREPHDVRIKSQRASREPH